MRILITGASGFLGWHLRARIHARTTHEVVAVGRSNWEDLQQLVRGTDAIIHLAGVNRGEPESVEAGNIALARELAQAVRQCGRTPRVLFANSVQAGNGSPYGNGKESASSILAKLASDYAKPYTDVVLPNLFGEGGRPDYNSFVATFVDRIVAGKPVDARDSELSLLHAQDAAEVFIKALSEDGGIRTPIGTQTTVNATLETLVRFYEVYRQGEIPPLDSRHEVNLLNTLRHALFTESPTSLLTRKADSRGVLVEAVRSHGSAGQTFVSKTKPGITRGQHFHLRKLERFAVVDGQASISLRRLFSKERHTFSVSGDEPVAIDMPTGWAHSITNTGDTSLTTVFWTNELFNPADTDTYPEEV